MFQGIAQSEDMYSPGDDILVLNRGHIFPGEFHMFSQGEAMKMYFSGCS